jgi:hypothetical protein
MMINLEECANLLMEECLCKKDRKTKTNTMDKNKLVKVCNSNTIEINQELLTDLPLYTKIKNFGGKDLLLLNLTYKKWCSYGVLQQFSLVGNGNAAKRDLKELGFIFEEKNDKDLMCIGFNDNFIPNRNIIPKSICKILTKQECGMCGSTTEVEVDHRKPTFRISNLPNEDLNDIKSYQPLCRRCNALKRSRCQTCKNTGIIKNRPDFAKDHQVKTKYDDSCSGCYWYDYTLVPLSKSEKIS